MEKKKIDRIIETVRSHLYEEPTMSLSHGKIAGTVEAGDEPPVRKKKGQCMSGDRGSRKFWLDYLNSSNGRRN
jgi:hypothetical protein